MSAPCQSACSPAIELADLCDPCLDQVAIDPDALEINIALATDLMYELTARQFPGTCRELVYVCDQRTTEYPSRHLPHRNGGGPCSCGHCRANPQHGVRLGFRPVSSIIEVKVADDSNPAWLDGAGTAVLDPSLYRVDDFEWLVRHPNPDGSRPGWPNGQDPILPPGSPGEFSVDFLYGLSPPPLIKRAVAAFACEFYLACRTGDDEAGGEFECRLPRNAVSVIRQGVAINLQEALGWFTSEPGKPIRTGLWEADAAIAVYNRHNLSSPMAVLSPDVPPAARRANTWPGT